jgi:signal transduction histidine kinase
MHLGIKGKQVLGVTAIVFVVVVALSLLYLSKLASASLKARAELITNAIFQRARDVVADAPDPYKALRADAGLRAILEASLYDPRVTFAAISDVHDVAIAHNLSEAEGRSIPPGEDLMNLVDQSGIAQLQAIYLAEGRNLEFRQPLRLGDKDFGSTRIGISTLLIRDDLDKLLGPTLGAGLAALAISVIAAMLLAQIFLRPIHVIRSGLTRLGRGEFGVRLDLNQNDEFGELGDFFNTVSAQLSADRSHMAGQVANLESAVEHLEDAVAIVNPRGELLFANPAMRSLLPTAAVGTLIGQLVTADHPLRSLVEETLLNRKSRGPLSATFVDAGERLLMTHAVSSSNGELVGVMVVARNLEYLGQVQSTIRYSRKLAALSRLSAGVAHEVKNPLNAMMIHLELLRQQFAGRTRPAPAVAGARRVAGDVVEAPSVDSAEAMQHVDVIAGEIKRLDEVVQGFLKFNRPEDLKLQPVSPAALFDEIVPIIRPEAERLNVALVINSDAPDVNGDPGMLRQAFLNLALNGCQAMPNGGTLRIHCEAARGHRVQVSFTDTGVGIKPEHLQRIFDLYFTTKEQGSGIGLSMVYRTVQMHDGDIEVQSTPGAGTTFRVFLPQA